MSAAARDGVAPGRPRFGYDVFLSHSHIDRDWVHALADRIAAVAYHGRPLRPWLDVQVLDPGNLGADAELTTALDRSRVFGLVLSPESAASHYVGLEIEHFLARRDPADLVALRLRPGPLPPALESVGDGRVTLIDVEDPATFENGLAALLDRVCPTGGPTPSDVAGAVDRAVEGVEAEDPGGLWPDPMPARDAFCDVLLEHDIDDAAGEGLALRAFDRAADHMTRLDRAGSDAAYNFRMLLAECLAAGLLRSSGYRSVARALLDRHRATIGAGRGGDPLALFVVARAYGKVAEFSPDLVDLSVLLRLAAELDHAGERTAERTTVERLVSRAAGKLRDRPVGELMLKALSERGPSSRVAAAYAIAMSPEHSGSEYYLTRLAERTPGPGLPEHPPSRRLLGLLTGIGLAAEGYVGPHARRAVEELEQGYPGVDRPYPLLWFPKWTTGPLATHHQVPFMGTVAKADLATMAERADRAEVATVACFTEARVVDALFWSCGGILVPEQDPDSHQCRRLRSRGVPFAMLPVDRIAELSDGDLVVVDEEALTVWTP